MVSFEFLAIILTGLGLTVSIVYYTTVLQNANETRQTRLFWDIHGSHISLPTMAITAELAYEWEWKDLDDFDEKYMMPNNKEDNVKFLHYFASLERIGVLMRRGLIDPELVYDSQMGTIIHIWEKFSPLMDEMRIKLNAPHIYVDPEHVYNELIQIRRERGHNPAELFKYDTKYRNTEK